MTRLGGLGESELLRRLLPYLTTTGYQVVAGEDDAAVWPSLDPDHPEDYVVASCDTSVEGVHFDLSWMPAVDIGYRALALALGDLASKGASPKYLLVALAAPPSWEVDTVTGLYEGIHRLAERFDINVAGGDLSSTQGPAVITLTVIGTAPLVPLARSKVQSGWLVGVTGPLGGASLALRERRVFLPRPDFERGKLLNQAELACGDISDGLLREMEKYAAVSGAGAVIRAQDVPVAAGATMIDALTGGEESEFVCVGPEDKLLRAGLHPIGVMTSTPDVRVIDANGADIQVATHGYDHFSR
ncbi:MAG TPA: thiamine-phosphate kinase [Candidatus Dormibacteraeota bacterium]|nr:thiamine-phosphate kinase [Candidatus Dormibacteraeota bacterium]